jgi:glycosyltransferase involved in cell wall biosynthesis
MRLACVVHRFGADIAGGSEGHCRLVAKHLADAHDVTILTTTARDHMTWRNEYPPGVSQLGRLRVQRFPVVRQRSLRHFSDLSERVFSGGVSALEQDGWFRHNGPEAPALLEHLQTAGRTYDRVLFWSFRYYQSYFGVPLVADRAVLLPTAEQDPAIRLGVLGAYFGLPAGMVYLTPEEQTLVERRMTGRVPPSCIIGCGLDPAPPADAAPLAALGLKPPFVLYLGRIDPNKGCDTLLRFYMRWADRTNSAAPLVLAGPANMPIPSHPRVVPVGFVDPSVRDALLAQASLLVVPSPFESLSMVLLEAWNHAVPALVNGRCHVLRGQVERAGGGLYYQNYDQFAGALTHLLDRPEVACTLGQAGRDYVDRHYRWPHVMDTLETFLASVGRSAVVS